MPKVVAGNNESAEQLLRRFRKVMTRSGVMGEVRRRRWHVSKSEQRRMEKKKAIRRARRRTAPTPNGHQRGNSNSRDNSDDNRRGGYDDM